MNKPVLSKELMEELSIFLMQYVDCKALDGITYAMVLSNQPADADRLKQLMEIKKKVMDAGFPDEAVFRCYKLSNGYVFDLDINVAKAITAKLAEKVAAANGGRTPAGDLIGQNPERRRQQDMEKLAKSCIDNFNKGIRKLEVALFSRNNVPRITINGHDDAGNPKLVIYDAYAIRHWDLEAVNTMYLAPRGVRIQSIVPCEILPSKTGVRVILTLAVAQ